MTIGLWVVLLALAWFVLAALIGPREKLRLEKVTDPY